MVLPTDAVFFEAEGFSPCAEKNSEDQNVLLLIIHISMVSVEVSIDF